MKAYVACILSLLLVSCCSNRRGESNTTEKVSRSFTVGMTYGEIIELLGEPDFSYGWGELRVGWKLKDAYWFTPSFYNGRVCKVIFVEDPFPLNERIYSEEIEKDSAQPKKKSEGSGSFLKYKAKQELNRDESSSEP